MLRIRKTLGTLNKFVEKICESPKQLAESGNLVKIIKLQSLDEMNKLLPIDFKFVRNIFQLLLAESIFKLM